MKKILALLAALALTVVALATPASAAPGLLYNGATSGGNVIYKTSSVSTATYQIKPGLTQPVGVGVYSWRIPVGCTGNAYLRNSAGAWVLSHAVKGGQWYVMKGNSYSPDVRVQVGC